MSRTETAIFSITELLQEVETGRIPFLCLQPKSSGISSNSLEELVEQAWTNPVEYPAISDSVFPGDHVAIVVAHTSNPLNNVARLIANRLNMTSGAEVTVVVAPQNWASFWHNHSTELNVVEHHGDNSNELALLAVGSHDQPLYVNRVLFDADIVLAVHSKPIQDEKGRADCVVPTFLGEDNQIEFSSAPPSERNGVIEQVNESLGTFAQFQIALAPGDAIGGIWYGERHAIAALAHFRNEELWRVPCPKRFEIACGTIEGTSQSWDDVARAIVELDKCVTSNGAIVLSCQLDKTPPKELRKAFLVDENELAKNASVELRQLATITKQHSVFLHSRLTADDIEALGFGHISSIDDLRRLIERSGEAVLVRDAHQCVITGTSE